MRRRGDLRGHMQTAGKNRDELVRLFVAVDLNDEVRASLAAEQSRLRDVIQGVKWVPPEQIHLTLVFLGDVFAGQVDGISGAIASVAGEFSAFYIQVAGLGFFGARHQPRVVWAGVGVGSREAMALQHCIAVELKTLNLTFDDRPFLPHLTLGRVKQPLQARGLAAVLDRSPMSVYGTVRVDQVLLMSSELHPQGPEYKVISHAFLSTQGQVIKCNR